MTRGTGRRPAGRGPAAVLWLGAMAACGCGAMHGGAGDDSRFVYADGIATFAPHGNLDRLKAGYGLRVGFGANDERTWRHDSGHYVEWTRHDVAGAQGAADLFSTGYIYRIRILSDPRPALEPVLLGGPAIGRFEEPGSDSWLAMGALAGVGLRIGADRSSSTMLSVTYSAWLGTGGESTGWGSAALSLTFHM